MGKELKEEVLFRESDEVSLFGIPEEALVVGEMRVGWMQVLQHIDHPLVIWIRILGPSEDTVITAHEVHGDADLVSQLVLLDWVRDESSYYVLAAWAVDLSQYDSVQIPAGDSLALEIR